MGSNCLFEVVFIIKSRKKAFEETKNDSQGLSLWTNIYQFSSSHAADAACWMNKTIIEYKKKLIHGKKPRDSWQKSVKSFGSLEHSQKTAHIENTQYQFFDTHIQLLRYSYIFLHLKETGFLRSFVYKNGKDLQYNTFHWFSIDPKLLKAQNRWGSHLNNKKRS